MITWIEAHGIETLLMYYAFSAITGGMPTPSDASGVGYRWLFSSFSILNASLARLVATQFSGSKMGSALNSPVSTPQNQVSTVQVQTIEPAGDNAVKVTTTETKEIGGK
jgi:hypothetical protein